MICRILKLLKRDQRGVAALEFAASLPLLFLLMFSVIEVTRFILVAQMVTNVARTVADLSAQGGVTDKTDLDNLLDAVEFVARPFDMQTDGRVIVSAINQATTPADSATPVLSIAAALSSTCTLFCSVEAAIFSFILSTAVQRASMDSSCTAANVSTW